MVVFPDQQVAQPQVGLGEADRFLDAQLAIAMDQHQAIAHLKLPAPLLAAAALQASISPKRQAGGGPRWRDCLQAAQFVSVA